MLLHNKAARLSLLDFHSIPMRAFHMTWFSFCLCFFGWFGIAPLMPLIRDEFHLTKDQIGNSVIASVAITIIGRLMIGWLLDRIGPRRCYTALLIVGALPVMCIGFAAGYPSFLIFRLAIGIVGASFVITQYHTTQMFAPGVVGTANALAAGWGNLGGGLAQIVMPLLFGTFMSLGAGSWWSWRLAMIIPGAAMFLAGIAYYFLTTDTADGDFEQLRARGVLGSKSGASGAFREALNDRRVWALGALYAASFGVELTIHNVAGLYFVDYFKLSLQTAGLVAGAYGMMDLFGRALGGIVSDRLSRRWGIRGRAILLACTLFCAGMALMLFSQARWLGAAIPGMLLTGLFVKMSNGATYAILPFVNKRAIGAVAGIVGSGGNAGSLLAGFLFKSSLTWPQAFLMLGGIVASVSVLAVAVRFAHETEPVHQTPARELVPAMAGD